MIKIFIDTETTGLKAFQNAVHQIAVIVEKDGVEQCIETFNCAPRPDDIIVQAALDVSDVTEEQIRAYPDADEVLHDQLIPLLDRYVDKYDTTDKAFFVGYNAPFDVGFMMQFFKKGGHQYFGSYFYKCAIDVLPLFMEHLSNVPDFKGLENFKLITAAKYMGFEFNEEYLHDAEFDIKLTRDLYLTIRALSNG